MLLGFISVDVCAPGRIKAHCTVLISDTDYFLAFYKRLRCQIQYQCFCVFNFNIFPVLLTCKKIKINHFRFLGKSWKIFQVFCHQTPVCTQEKRGSNREETSSASHQHVVVDVLFSTSGRIFTLSHNHNWKLCSITNHLPAKAGNVGTTFCLFCVLMP